jgi:hypothetical protein
VHRNAQRRVARSRRGWRRHRASSGGKEPRGAGRTAGVGFLIHRLAVAAAATATGRSTGGHGLGTRASRHGQRRAAAAACG